ncbi:hypothetical protein PVAP13_2NG095600 [Panicum virgatum]|uniref:Uncharacterized protein n=1 Tax=Panicum virgatum TaxID=38727 RepID=A0A8T0V6U2_PANVG|nr:hypothetical protein PVAP13_2NG095600 [Panicum virgatum]
MSWFNELCYLRFSIGDWLITSAIHIIKWFLKSVTFHLPSLGAVCWMFEVLMGYHLIILFQQINN